MGPDRLEKKLRFGCGFLFGILFGFFSVIRYVTDSVGILAGCVLTTAVVCGLLALRYGDRFWERLSSLRWWWM